MSEWFQSIVHIASLLVVVVIYIVSTKISVDNLKEFLEQHERRELLAISELKADLSSLNRMNSKDHATLHERINQTSEQVARISGKIGNGRGVN